MAEPAPKRRVLGGFEILNKIGQGGMGAVFKARQISLEREVALKILPPGLAKRDSQFVDRFIREARVSARLNHPNIVQGIEVGKDEGSGLYYFAMEYVDGPTIRKLIEEQGRLGEGQAHEIVSGMAQALICASKAGIVHRDIKPDNILITSRGEPKLADLGLARRVVEGDEPLPAVDLTNGQGPSADAALTEGGKALGTPFYMSPEQAAGRHGAVDIRSDLYALGATWFHMVTGNPPFSGANSKAIMQARLTQAAPDPRTLRSDLSAQTAATIRRLLEREPGRRFQSPEELAAALDAMGTPVGADARPGSTSAAKPARGARTAKDGGRTTALARVAEGKPVWPYAAAGIAVLVCGAFIALRSGGGAGRPANAETSLAKAGDKALPYLPPLAPKTTAASSPTPALEKVAPKEEPKPETVPGTVQALGDLVNKSSDLARKADGAGEKKEALTSTAPAVPDKTPSKPEPVPAEPAKPVQETPAPGPSPAVAQAFEKALDDCEVLVGKGALEDARKALAEANRNPDWTSFAPRLRSAQVWAKGPEEQARALEAGARVLLDGRAFTLELADGKKESVGADTNGKFLGIRNGALDIEVSQKEQGQMLSFRRSYKWEQLAASTQAALALLSAGDEAKAKGALAARQAVMDLCALAAGKAGALLPEVIELNLAEARGAGAPAELLAFAEERLTRAKARASAARAEAGKKGEEAKAKQLVQWYAENPWRKTRMGDWAEYKLLWGKGKRRNTVITVSPAAVTIKRHEKWLDGNETNKEYTMDLTKPFDPYSAEWGPDWEKKKLAEGDETIKAAGRTYACHWVLASIQHDKTLWGKEKIWVCPEAPFNGVVQFENLWDKEKTGPGRITGPYGYHSLLAEMGKGPGENVGPSAAPPATPAPAPAPGDWIDMLAGNGLDDWSATGDWKRDGKTVECTGRALLSYLCYNPQFDNFEVSATMEIVKEPPSGVRTAQFLLIPMGDGPALNVGISRDGKCWTIDKKGDTHNSAPVQVPREPLNLRVIHFKGLVQLFHNDVKVLEHDFKTPVAVLAGIGCYYKTVGAVVRFSNLRIRALNQKPAP